MDTQESLVKKRPIGVIVFSVLLIYSSLSQLEQFTSLNQYHLVFQPLPENIIRLRFFVSIVIRVIGLISGIGLLFRRDFFRKLAIFSASFTLLTIYWKHPFFVVDKYSKIIAFSIARHSMGEQMVLPHTNIYTTTLALILLYSIDIIFSGCLIFYLTRRKVKTWFK